MVVDPTVVVNSTVVFPHHAIMPSCRTFHFACDGGEQITADTPSFNSTLCWRKELLVEGTKPCSTEQIRSTNSFTRQLHPVGAGTSKQNILDSFAKYQKLSNIDCLSMRGIARSRATSWVKLPELGILLDGVVHAQEFVACVTVVNLV